MMHTYIHTYCGCTDARLGKPLQFDQHPDLGRNASRPFQRNVKYLTETAHLSAVSLGSTIVFIDYTKCRQCIHLERRIESIKLSPSVYLGVKVFLPALFFFFLWHSLILSQIHEIVNKVSKQQIRLHFQTQRGWCWMQVQLIRLNTLHFTSRSADAFFPPVIDILHTRRSTAKWRDV